MHLLIALKAFFLGLFNGTLAAWKCCGSVMTACVARLTQPCHNPGPADTAVEHKREAMRRMARLPWTKVGKRRGKPARKGPAKRGNRTIDRAEREGRFVDFLKEDLTSYGDAQIGAVARDLHRDCAKVVERMFAIKPLVTQADGAAIEVPSGFDAARYRLVGNVAGAAPFRGTLVHHGWQATKCELAEWVGGEDSSR